MPKIIFRLSEKELADLFSNKVSLMKPVLQKIWEQVERAKELKERKEA